MLCSLSGTGLLFLLPSSKESQIHLILSEEGPESQRPAVQLHIMFKGAPAAPPSLAMVLMFVHTWATLIHQQIYFPLVLGPLVLLLEDVRIDEMTRRDTALNWSTVAFTVGALPSFFFLPHTQPRQCQATTFLNSFCLTEKSATIKNQFCNDIICMTVHTVYSLRLIDRKRFL